MCACVGVHVRVCMMQVSPTNFPINYAKLSSTSTHCCLQGNSTLDLPNAEERSESWAEDGKLLEYSFVDDADEEDRYDAALFYVRN